MSRWLRMTLRFDAAFLLSQLGWILISQNVLAANDVSLVPVMARGAAAQGDVLQVAATNPIRARQEASLAEPSKSSEQAEPSEQVSDAERIGHLQRTIEKDQSQLAHLQQELKSADEEFNLAGRIFNKVDDKWKALRKQLDAAKESGNPAEITALEAELTDAKVKHSLCQERFDLSIQAKKGLQQQIAALKEKIERDSAALAKLSGVETAGVSPAGSDQSEPRHLPSAESERAPAAEKAEAKPEVKAAEVESKTAVEPARPTIAGGAIAAGVQNLPAEDESAAAGEMQEARSEASRKAAEANEAREALQAIDDRQQSLDKNIELEQKLRDAARKQADNALRVAQEFHEDYRKLSESNAPPEELSKIGQRIQASELRLEKSREEMKRRSDRLDDLQSQRHALMLERIAALNQAEQQTLAADEAKRRVEALENPFSQRNLARWAMRHAPNIFVIIAGMLMLQVVAKVVSRRVVVLMSHKGSGSHKERENRAQTIVGVFHNAATVVGYGGGTLMILEECGVPVGPLLGGAAVFGLAVAFGSQNLIRDYFYGFVILLENQYGVNDIVKIGDVTGQVERITLRMTVVRDSDGVNFIPNGQIASVKNLTHGWSQAAFEIAVDYKEDLDHVMDVLMELGRELRRDSIFADKILNDPTMQGVDVLGDSAVTIKMSIKTRPFEQWSVKREMLRRVKKRFEERGIQLPMAQRTVVHRYARSEDDLVRAEEDARWNQRKSA